MDEGEEWRPIAGFEGYEITRTGEIRSWRRRSTPRLLSTFPNRDGHIVCGLYRNGKAQGKQVHRLVLETFVGPAPAGLIGCHNDGNPANNHVDNLRWDTHASNTEDMVAHGTKRQGSECGHSKLTEGEVLEILRQIEAGVAGQRLARDYNVTKAAVYNITSGRAWGWLTGRSYTPLAKREAA
jgi:hypothetical protein